MAGSEIPRSSTTPKQRADDESATDEESEDMLDEGDVLEGRFTVLEKLQSGSFGQVFLAVDGANKDLEVALKVEKPRPTGKRSFCAHEVGILRRCQGLSQVPEMYAFNTMPPLPYIAMQLMSFSLAEMRRSCPIMGTRRFSLSTAIRLGIQCFTATRQVHGVGVVHRDIKPANFMLGASEETRHRVYIVDYGLSRFYVKPNGELFPPRDRPGFVGSTRYASPNAHDALELGRGDDLMSLLYVMVEMRRGRLPWRKAGDRAAVGAVKKSTTFEALCRGLPPAMAEFGKLVRPLRYEDEPAYDTLGQLLRSIVRDNNIAEDTPFDWEENFLHMLREDERNRPASDPGEQ